MKYTKALLLFSLCCLVTSCDAFKDDFEFKNTTDYAIDFYIQDTEKNYTINPKANIELELYSHPRVEIKSKLPVYCTVASSFATFYEWEKTDINIENKCSFDIFVVSSSQFDDEFLIKQNSIEKISIYSKNCCLQCDNSEKIKILPTQTIYQYNNHNLFITMNENRIKITEL